jgi:hypothetical protein
MTSPKPKKQHGGQRAGAGRPPKVPRQPPNPDAAPLTAEEYLQRVVSGQEQPDAVRTRAALGLIRYQQPAQRAPLPTPPARELSQKAVRAVDKVVADEFEKRAAEIRARHAQRKSR